MIEVRDFTVAGWAAAERKGERARWYCERLEEGEVLFFDQTPFLLPDDDRAFLVNVRQAGSTYYKNISYRPKQDRVRGFARASADQKTLRGILRTYSRRATQFVSELLSPYAERWQVDFASFRPLEEQGRELSLRARNDLLHIDAFPTRPTDGNRILRVFTNINPTQPRVWVTTETLEVLAEKYAMLAGLSRIAAEGRSPYRRLCRLLIRLARFVGIPLIERSPYDQFMLGFHHYLKANQAFQEGCAKSRWEFPPNSTWIAFTDMVPHAALSGQFALEQTFIVSCDSLLMPHKAPIQILEKLCNTVLRN